MPNNTASDVAIAAPMAPVPCTIRSVRDDTADTFTLALDPPADGFRFGPGQFNMLYSFGVGEVPISISGDPGDDSVLVHTVRAVGAVTRALRKVQPGDMIGVRGPFGTTWPTAAARGGDVLIVAGGIGLAPLRPALLDVLAHRDDYGRVALLYGTRTPADLLFTRELSEWRGRFDMDVLVTVDTAGPDWYGSVGVVTKLIPRAPFEGQRTTAFVCGPEVMMRFTARELVGRGVDPARVHVSMERNMKCGFGICGHCQFGPHFVCKDGAVFPYAAIAPLLEIREI